jgi:hypothetical protein
VEHTCPVCGGCGCVPCDDRNGNAHYTEPCPIEVGCNGAGLVSHHKYLKILSKTKNGCILCDETGKKYRVNL